MMPRNMLTFLRSFVEIRLQVEYMETSHPAQENMSAAANMLTLMVFPNLSVLYACVGACVSVHAPMKVTQQQDRLKEGIPAGR